MGRLGRVASGVFGLVAVLVLACLLASPVSGLAASDKPADASSETAAKDDGEKKAPLETWDTDLDCASCHEGEAQDVSNKACLVSMHSFVECTVCHNQGTVLQQRHDNPGKRLPTRLKKTSVEDAVCLTCHAGADANEADEADEAMSALAEATSKSEVLTDKNGRVVNPHDIPENVGHKELACTKCHKLHDDEADLDKLARLTCTGCHHDNVYACGTCHAY